MSFDTQPRHTTDGITLVDAVKAFAMLALGLVIGTAYEILRRMDYV